MINISVKVSTGGLVDRREKTTERKIHLIMIVQNNLYEGRMHQQDGQAHINTTPAVNIETIRLRQKGSDGRKEDTHNQDRKDELIEGIEASTGRAGVQ